MKTGIQGWCAACLIGAILLSHPQVRATEPSIEELLSKQSWEQLESEGQARYDTAYRLTGPGKQPWTKDYFKAAKLYWEAASYFDLARIKLERSNPPSMPLDPAQQEKVAQLKDKVVRLRDMSSEAKNQALSRERRGLL